MGKGAELEASSRPPACDVLVFVATQLELEALKHAALARGLAFEEQKSAIGTFYPLGVLGGRRVVAAKTSTGGFGPKGSSANDRFYVEATGAAHLLLVGIAFGIDPKTQKAGDVLVSSHVFAYDDRSVVDERAQWHYDYEARGIRMFRASGALVNMAEEFLRRPQNRGRARLGCLLTGSALVQSARYRDYLVERCSMAAKNIIGGEMEAIGLLSLHERSQCIWLAVKGISDFADGNLGPDPNASRALACSNAATFVLDALDSWA